MNKITKENLYERREMKTRRKMYSIFNCSSCKKIVSIETHPHFFLVAEHLTGPIESSGRYCSTDCVFNHLDSLNINIDRIIEEHNELMDKIDSH
ncbi:hypothetical protein B5V89_06810 [Heyndrickxia sporothermodurans]|nr:hypothetical protein B5V89_06810 [Heyndrickxia sporothermodurans]